MADKRRHRFDVLVIGGGPAGLAAAASASASGASVALVDDNPEPGGQIWRGDTLHSDPEAAHWGEKVRRANVMLFGATHVFHHDLQSRRMFAEGRDALHEFVFSKLILATGARERLLPFPGWTLPNVMAAGGLQAMAKSGLPVEGKRVVVAGTGPLLLAVASYLKKHGAIVKAICEQASWRSLIHFGATLAGTPPRLKQALRLAWELRSTPFWGGTWPVRAHGERVLEAVDISRGGRIHSIACDYLSVGFHLVPNIELPASLGCEIAAGFVRVDERQQTSLPDVFCAGEPTGIGGLESALIEGQISGLAATGQTDALSKLQRRRDHLQPFVRRLEIAFRLRNDLKSLPQQETVICRCEDVTYERVGRYTCWRDAKNQTRCGMGPCQGRICGPATHFLCGWPTESFRPPLLPVTIGSLAAISQRTESTVQNIATGAMQ